MSAARAAPQGARRGERAQRQLRDQPAAGVADAAVALASSWSRWSAWASCVLLGRAVYVQIVDAPFFLKQGEIRYAPHARAAGQPRPHHRPQRPDPRHQRAGAVDLGDPEGPRRRRRRSARQLAKLLDMTAGRAREQLARRQPELRLAAAPGRRRRRASRCAALGIKGIHQLREYKRKYPEGEAAAHVVGFTNVEDHGQEGIELAFQKELAGRDGSRRVIKDRLGRVVEDVGDSVAAGRRPGHRPGDRFEGAVLRLPAGARRGGRATRPRPAAWWCSTRRPARCWRWPTTRATRPADRRNLTGEQLRNRALTDTFEPGSTMKPFIAGLGAGDRPRHADDRDPDRARPITIDRLDDQRRAPARRR